MIHLFNPRNSSDFRQSLDSEFKEYLNQENLRFPREDCLKIDLHCHDHNSDVPDELWGRILGLPETWLKTKKLVKLLNSNDCDLVTVTNHNNARSCWNLLKKGQDVLVAAEFTCYFPEYELFVHVLTYGFTQEQEIILNEKRSNIYDFLRYTAQCDIPVILPHPLYFYTRNEKIELELFEKFAVMFERFEVLNGQRDLWQSVLTLNWVQGLTSDKIKMYAKKHGLKPEEFAVDPNKPKVLTGGSDDHMGIFAGDCGSMLYIPNLKERLKTSKASELALEAIRNGNMSPFGYVAENQKLNIALLDYFTQIASKIKDPGLLRILLHYGDTMDKVSCFAISNLLLEMQKHKHTMKFFGFIHDALQGKKPSKLLQWQISKDYKFCIKYLEDIADSKKQSPEKFVDTVNRSITELFTQLNYLIVKRINKTRFVKDGNILKCFSTEEFTRKFEIPSQVTALIYGKGKRPKDFSGLDFNDLLDNLSFPVLITIVLTGVTLASTRLLYQNREFLNQFAENIGKNKHRKRALYLTDTLKDKNGVSNSLSGKLAEIQRTDLPIDFLICHESAEEESHLFVLPPVASFNIPNYGEQKIRMPDLMEIVKIFYSGGYDRIICSTEGPMTLVSLFLKEMFNVPCFFFMHTDWIDFIKHTTNLNRHERDRMRRLLRMLYKQYDGVFVLNNEHKGWLTGHEMQLDEDKVFLTAHHTKPRNYNVKPIQKPLLFPGCNENTPVLFLACRLSREKGIFELPEIIKKAKLTIPELKIVIAGSGPDAEELKSELPEALYLGWQSHEQLASLYLGLDLFVFPSQFDTFGNVILEAFNHGMPVVAFDCKGPKDIIEHQVNGYLVNDNQQMAESIIQYFKTKTLNQEMSVSAIERAKSYQAEPIMKQFLSDLGLLENNTKEVSTDELIMEINNNTSEHDDVKRSVA
ncbi:glycosyltransferase [Aliikangiella sp. IMCC44359]|uniref:glycosyltransferase n=1 Tax=Aliikangiella sp. IMCC44359 TaxID=3459125 RepID=UPI00403AB884